MADDKGKEVPDDFALPEFKISLQEDSIPATLVEPYLVIDSAEPITTSKINQEVDAEDESDPLLVNFESELPPEALPTPHVVLRQGPWLHPFPKIVGFTIFALIIALIGSVYTTEKYAAELRKTDFYHAPPNLAQLIERVQKSTMVITCGDSLGSGWVIDLGPVSPTADAEAKRIDREYPGEVITNYHVIKDCVTNTDAVTTSNGKKNYEAILFSYDEENDLAIVSTKLILPPLQMSDTPSPGWWSMALGSPFGFEKSVSIGNVMNFVDDRVISTAPINHGNSGGPLVNAFGEVMGTNTAYLPDAQSINIAMSTDLLYSRLVTRG